MIFFFLLTHLVTTNSSCKSSKPLKEGWTPMLKTVILDFDLSLTLSLIGISMKKMDRMNVTYYSRLYINYMTQYL